MKYLSILLVLFWSIPIFAEENLAQHLQDVSVTIKSNRGSGSGIIITRDVQISKENDTKQKVNFILTAGHVVSSLRSVRTVIVDGKETKVITFRDASLVKQLVEKGRKVGQLEMECKVLKYSDADNGEDIALLMVRKRDFVSASVNFYLSDNLVPIGTQLFHVGSLLGEAGSNSMTSGIMSQVGRVLNLGVGDGVVFDQTSVTSFPGSSGGGVFFATGDNAGKYIGMLVRGSGEGFNFIVPIRRMIHWAKINNVEWVLNSDIPTPTLKVILNMKNEAGANDKKNRSDGEPSKFPFLFNSP